MARCGITVAIAVLGTNKRDNGTVCAENRCKLPMGEIACEPVALCVNHAESCRNLLKSTAVPFKSV